MAKHKSAEKRARQSVVRRARNASVKSALRTAHKKLVAALEAGDKEKAQALLAPTCREWDKAVSKNVVHGNTAARSKSRLTVHVTELVTGKKRAGKAPVQPRRRAVSDAVVEETN